MEDAVQELLDKQACEEVIMRYGRTLDWLDEEGQAACFWPDAEVDYGFFKGSALDWVPLVMQVEQGSANRWHMCANVLVKVEGHRAHSECYGFTVATIADDSGDKTDTLFGGRYLDELQKRDGQWRIFRRSYIADWVQQLTSGMDAVERGELQLNVLNIAKPGHRSYRKL